MADEKQREILIRSVDVWNKWREDNPDVEIDLNNADLMGTNLKAANLQKAHLSDADLVLADLSNADLTGVHLTGANLSGATLLRANLGKADLRRATLTMADLSNADFTGAVLANVNLSGADFTETNLADTSMMNTILGNIDLSRSLGLMTIRHIGPSTIGTDTIRQSKGKIPIEFLRGCGLSNLDIEYTKLAAPGLDPEQVALITYEIHRLYCDQPVLFHSCFISYNNKDQDFAQRMHDELQDNGVRCWFAPEDMKIGDEFRKAIGLQIRLREKLLIILSENSIHSEWVGDEVEKAVAEEKEQGTLKLFPIQLDNAVFEARDDWAEKIRLRRHIGDFSNWQDEASYHKSFERLLRDLKAQ
jgi:uncharacterized protein YjbI with pentapeptide repeats